MRNDHYSLLRLAEQMKDQAILDATELDVDRISMPLVCISTMRRFTSSFPHVWALSQPTSASLDALVSRIAEHIAAQGVRDAILSGAARGLNKEVRESFLLDEEFFTFKQLLLRDGMSLDTELNQFVVLSCMAQTHSVMECFKTAGADPVAFAEVAKAFSNGTRPLPHMNREVKKREELVKARTALVKFGIDLTDLAARGLLDAATGREHEIDRLIEVLSRSKKNNPLLLGDPGVGKTAIVEGLALRIVQKDVPLALRNKNIIRIDLSKVMAGAKFQGDLEERIEMIKNEAAADRNIVLFIDEVHSLLSVGRGSGIDAANALKPALASGDISVIGATTYPEFKRSIETDKALERRFTVIHVPEPSMEVAIKMLTKAKEKLENHHRVLISEDIVKTAVELSIRFLPTKKLPDKAVDALDEAAVLARLEHEQKTGKDNSYFQAPSLMDLSRLISHDGGTTMLHDARKASLAGLVPGLLELATQTIPLPAVSRQHVAIAIANLSGVPAQETSLTNFARLAGLEQRLAQRVMGQETATTAVGRILRRNMLGLKERHGVIGSFLFLGPSGVGKTELAKSIAVLIAGTEKKLIRFDMSEYSAEHEVSKLIGSPPGYVGFGAGGQLTEAVKKNPHCVILFDEVEKAHPRIFDALLQVLDDGRLTDGQGDTVFFDNTIVVFTSNIGSDVFSGESKTVALGFDANATTHNSIFKETKIKDQLRNFFRIEFLNRLDEVIFFKTLETETLQKIATKILSDLKRRLAGLGVVLTFTDELVHLLARSGSLGTAGARPLRRMVEREIEGEIARLYADACALRLSAVTGIAVATVDNDKIVVNFQETTL